MLKLDVISFDRTQGQGWRLIADRECYSEAAKLIAEYRAHADDPNVARHHQVQMHAAAEERDQAIILLDELIADDKANQDWVNLHYRRATRAFLAGNLQTLQSVSKETILTSQLRNGLRIWTWWMLFLPALIRVTTKHIAEKPVVTPAKIRLMEADLSLFSAAPNCQMPHRFVRPKLAPKRTLAQGSPMIQWGSL